ncbi:membrane bound O-acyl transferase family-domain-containing protein [Mycena latifolia]|nr:membrane bound O-acyl transferase family-domain-containing protein [Mycena latifolia]
MLPFSGRVLPFSEALIPPFIALILAALAAKPSPYRRLFFVPVLFLTYFFLLHTTSGTPTTDYSLRLLTFDHRATRQLNSAAARGRAKLNYFLLTHFPLTGSYGELRERYVYLFTLILQSLTIDVACTYCVRTGLPGSHRLFWLLYFLFACDYILLTDVQRQLHRVPPSPSLPEDDATESAVAPSIEGAPLWQRLKWSVDLFTSPRGVNWTHEPLSAIPPHPDPATPRLSFILRQILKVVGVFIVYDIASLYVRSQAAFEPGVDTGMASLDVRRRFAAVIAWAALGYSGMALQHCLLGIICVAVHLTGPEEWPAFFGGVGDAWSVRSFWGRGWHQMLRRPLTTHAYRLTSALGFASGSRTTRALQLFAVFLLSGLMHYGAEAAVAGPWHLGALFFFALEIALAILMEGAVEARVVLQLAPLWLRKALGYGWTLAWFTFTLPLWQDPLIRGGLMDRGLPAEASLIALVWRVVCNTHWQVV